MVSSLQKVEVAQLAQVPKVQIPASPALNASENTQELAQLWMEIVPQLGLKALAAQLAKQSELISLSSDSMILRCEKRSLATDEHAVKTLKSALHAYFTQRGQDVPTLKIEMGEIGQVSQSPQKIMAKQRDDSLADARHIVQQHPVIQAIVHEFDGMILPNSITPE